MEYATKAMEEQKAALHRAHNSGGVQGGRPVPDAQTIRGAQDQQSPVADALEYLGSSQSRLREVAQHLRDRLGPVLRTQQPSPAECGTQPMSLPESALVAVIKEAALEARQMGDMLIDLNERLVL